MRRMTFEEFNEKAHKVLGDDYIFYPPYVNMKTPVKYKHLVCNTEDTLIPSNIFSGGASCKHCNEVKKAKKREISFAEFKKRLHKVRPNDDIKLIEPLHGLFKKTEAECLVCDYGKDGEWTPLPINLLKGKGCPNCAGNAPKTDDKLVNEVQTLGKSEYDLLGTKRTKKDGLWLHLYHHVCHNDYWVRDYSFLAGYRCRFCQAKQTGDRCRLSIKDLRKRVANVADHSYKYISGSYKNNRSRIFVEHTKCKTIYPTTWGALSQNSGLCPQCNATSGEQQVMAYLNQCGAYYMYGYLIPDLKDKQSLHFDFWLPDLNTAIEYDGKQHYEPIDLFGGEDGFKLRKKHDQMKDYYCKEHSIKLIRIPYNQKVDEILDSELAL